MEAPAAQVHAVSGPGITTYLGLLTPKGELDCPRQPCHLRPEADSGKRMFVNADTASFKVQVHGRIVAFACFMWATGHAPWSAGLMSNPTWVEPGCTVRFLPGDIEVRIDADLSDFYSRQTAADPRQLYGRRRLRESGRRLIGRGTE